MLAQSYSSYLINFKEANLVIRDIETASHYVSTFLLYAKASSHASPDIEKAESKV